MGNWMPRKKKKKKKKKRKNKQKTKQTNKQNKKKMNWANVKEQVQLMTVVFNIFINEDNR